MTDDVILAALQLLGLASTFALVSWLNYRLLQRVGGALSGLRRSGARSLASARPTPLGLGVAR